ncbi:4-hydroxyphenylpyruvate dioxygenase [hydrothermal vent metagenome]|uniref:4-hydroxyphenylpyruvate dioxygenase n=1 Tax=hydrothermal vent metagenome TaxID=652676 RepID=A0A3B0Y2S1_9ZZZZ
MGPVMPTSKEKIANNKASAIDNPMGTDGFEFIEYAAENTQQLTALFQKLGFKLTAHHRSKHVELYTQGDTHFLINHEPDSFAQQFARKHGPCVCAFALRVRDAAFAYERALSLGAKAFHGEPGPMELNIPAIQGIGGSVLYLVDRYGENSIYDVDFVALQDNSPEVNPAIKKIDHLTHNVHQGRMDYWADFYINLFNFRQIRYFDIKGLKTGLHSRALVSPCGKIRIPINESSDNQSQIAEYLRQYHGEGVQHIALETEDIYATVEQFAKNGIRFLPVPDTYYEMIADRLPGHNEDVMRMQQDKILIDGTVDEDSKLLLQIFTENVIGPVFFEIIQRKGNEGFGEGNFQALFESIELEQIKRGVLK